MSICSAPSAACIWMSSIRLSVHVGAVMSKGASTRASTDFAIAAGSLKICGFVGAKGRVPSGASVTTAGVMSTVGACAVVDFRATSATRGAFVTGAITSGARSASLTAATGAVGATRNCEASVTGASTATVTGAAVVAVGVRVCCTTICATGSVGAALAVLMAVRMPVSGAVVTVSTGRPCAGRAAMGPACRVRISVMSSPPASGVASPGTVICVCTGTSCPVRRRPIWFNTLLRAAASVSGSPVSSSAGISPSTGMSPVFTAFITAARICAGSASAGKLRAARSRTGRPSTTSPSPRVSLI